MMRPMTEGPGQQPSQQPSPSAPEGREVLEGRVIPSSRQQQRSFEAHQPHRPQHSPQQDPRQQFATGAGTQGEPWSSPQAGGGQGAQPPQAGQAPQSPQSPQAAQDPAAGQGGQGGQGGQNGQPPLPHRDGPASERPGPHQQVPQHSPQPQLPGSPDQAAGQPGAGDPPGRQQGGVPQQGGAAQQGFPHQGGAPQQQGLPPQGFGQPGPAGAGLPRQSPSPASSASSASPAPPGGRSASRSAAPGTPDWNALAEQQEASGARRRKMMMLTGGIVAIAVIAGGVATAVVMSGKSSKPTVAGPSASGSTTTSPLPPAPSFSSVAPPPPANPLDYLSTAGKDKAPLTTDTLFPGKQFLMDGRVYAKTATATTTSCASAARAGLSAALGKSGCRKLIRVTYTNGTTAVTVGVAVFDDKAHAQKLQKVAQYLAPLNGGGVADFCHAVACRMTSNAVGRYAYFAIAGLKNGKTITATDTAALQSANDASNFAFQRIIQRGRDAASADPARN